MTCQASLPGEILAAIFRHTVLPADIDEIWSSYPVKWHRTSINDTQDPEQYEGPPYELPFSPQEYLVPLAISHVCRRWHDIVTNLPELWSLIVINDALGLSQNTRFAATYLSIWIERSGSIPITFVFISSPQSYFALACECLERMFALFHRWKNVFLCLNWGMNISSQRLSDDTEDTARNITRYLPPAEGFNLQTPTSTPLLESAFIELTGLSTLFQTAPDVLMGTAVRPICLSLEVILNKSVKLRRIHTFQNPTERGSAPWFYAILPGRTPVYDSLTDITASCMTVHAALSLLRISPVVQSAEFGCVPFGSSRREDYIRPFTSIPPTPTVHLSHLISFRIIVRTARKLEYLLNSIAAAPCLKNLTLSFPDPASYPQLEHALMYSFSSFLSRSNCELRTFSVDLCEPSDRHSRLPIPFLHSSFATLNEITMIGANIKRILRFLVHTSANNSLESMSFTSCPLETNRSIFLLFGNPTTLFPRLLFLHYETAGKLLEEMGLVLYHIDSPCLQKLSIVYVGTEELPRWPKAHFESFVSKTQLTHLRLQFYPKNSPYISRFDLLEILRLPQINANLQNLALQSPSIPLVTDALVQLLMINPQDGTIDSPIALLLPSLRSLLLIDLCAPIESLAFSDMISSRLQCSKLRRCIAYFDWGNLRLESATGDAIQDLSCFNPLLLGLEFPGKTQILTRRAGLHDVWLRYCEEDV